MRIIILIAVFALMVSCGEEAFEKAEMSECLNNPAANNTIQPKVEITEETDEMVVNDEEISDSDVLEEGAIRSVTLIEKTKNKLSFYYQANFACKGYEFGYEIESNSADQTELFLYLKYKDTLPNENVKCVCSQKMTVEYSSDSIDLTKIEKIKVYDGDVEFLFQF